MSSKAKAGLYGYSVTELREMAPHSCGSRKRNTRRKLGALVPWWFMLWASLVRITLSESSQATIKTSVDQSTISIGDVLNLKVEISHPVAMRIQFPSLTDQLGVWTVRQARHSVMAGRQPDWSTDVYDVRLTIYRTGDFEIPPCEVELLDRSGKTEKVISSAIPIKVQSVLAGGDETLKDLKPQAEIPPDYKPFLLTLVAILAGLILIYQLIRHFRKRKHIEESIAVDWRSPEEIAREAIGRLLALRLIEQGLYKDFYLEISEIIKRYLGSRLGILSLERTTEEFMGDLRTTLLPPSQIGLIGHFLNNCDLVKFAKYHPSDEEVKEIVEISYGLVETTEKELVAPVTAAEVEGQ